MAITLTLNNLKEAEVVLEALSVHYDITDDMVLKAMHMSTDKFRDIASQHDNFIRGKLGEIRFETNRRINTLLTTERVLTRLRAAITLEQELS